MRCCDVCLAVSCASGGHSALKTDRVVGKGNEGFFLIVNSINIYWYYIITSRGFLGGPFPPPTLAESGTSGVVVEGKRPFSVWEVAVGCCSSFLLSKSSWQYLHTVLFDSFSKSSLNFWLEHFVHITCNDVIQFMTTQFFGTLIDV